ncbi:MAG TPA: hypothetical protein VIK81_05310, partial [Patescibacteria group bacterium]
MSSSGVESVPGLSIFLEQTEASKQPLPELDKSGRKFWKVIQTHNGDVTPITILVKILTSKDLASHSPRGFGFAAVYVSEEAKTIIQEITQKGEFKALTEACNGHCLEVKKEMIALGWDEHMKKRILAYGYSNKGRILLGMDGFFGTPPGSYERLQAELAFDTATRLLTIG